MPAALPWPALETSGTDAALSWTGTWTPRTLTGTSLLQASPVVLGAKSLELTSPFWGRRAVGVLGAGERHPGGGDEAGADQGGRQDDLAHHGHGSSSRGGSAGPSPLWPLCATVCDRPNTWRQRLRRSPGHGFRTPICRTGDGRPRGACSGHGGRRGPGDPRGGPQRRHPARAEPARAADPGRDHPRRAACLDAGAAIVHNHHDDPMFTADGVHALEPYVRPGSPSSPRARTPCSTRRWARGRAESPSRRAGPTSRRSPGAASAG